MLNKWRWFCEIVTRPRSALGATCQHLLMPIGTSKVRPNPTSALFVTTGAKFEPGGVLDGSYVVDFV
jgi:hypothetical protein